MHLTNFCKWMKYEELQRIESYPHSERTGHRGKKKNALDVSDGSNFFGFYAFFMPFFSLEAPKNWTALNLLKRGDNLYWQTISETREHIIFVSLNPPLKSFIMFRYVCPIHCIINNHVAYRNVFLFRAGVSLKILTILKLLVYWFLM